MVRRVARIIKPNPDPGKPTRDLLKQVNNAVSIDWMDCGSVKLPAQVVPYLLNLPVLIFITTFRRSGWESVERADLMTPTIREVGTREYGGSQMPNLESPSKKKKWYLSARYTLEEDMLDESYMKLQQQSGRSESGIMLMMKRMTAFSESLRICASS
ncbi:hypothetical protein ARMSODRAFT_980876 [Armillaria solidipes]|uniref:Uncharacterized protein n=1 Tax=Armillaria solidipes TaxID=1076256 RepID=A0A2H3BGT5_9AGAR|nr:hypothetical protein ARMSODRAFT_980876 [Armillaria solidipes]